MSSSGFNVPTARRDLRTEELLGIIDRETPPPPAPHHIVVIGAGISGLVTAGLLKRWGFEVTVLEASNVVGGRVKTVRSPLSPGVYCDVGAMRIPRTHMLVHDYIERVGLSGKLNNFRSEVPENLIYVNGVKATFGEYRADPDVLQYPVNVRERGRDADELWRMATEPVLAFIREDPTANWPSVVRDYDRHSIRTYLTALRNRRAPEFSEAAIEMMGVLLNVESVMMTSFVEGLRDQLELNLGGTYHELLGGNDQLPWSLVRHYGLADDIQFNSRMAGIRQDAHSVTVHYESSVANRSRTVVCDKAIVTIPFTALRMVAIEPGCFSRDKMRAIRALHYDTSTKVVLEFKSRFWETRDDIYGGRSVTDLPIRSVYYPSHGHGEPGPAALIASYTWCDDSLRWDSLSEQDRIRNALRDLAVLHGEVVYEEFRQGISHSWLLDPYSCGAFALFAPEQQTQLHNAIATPEGRIHFAGEHTTLKHAWIEGAIESGIRAAVEVHPVVAEAAPAACSEPRIGVAANGRGPSAEAEECKHLALLGRTRP